MNEKVNIKFKKITIFGCAKDFSAFIIIKSLDWFTILKNSPKFVFWSSFFS